MSIAFNLSAAIRKTKTVTSVGVWDQHARTALPNLHQLSIGGLSEVPHDPLALIAEYILAGYLEEKVFSPNVQPSVALEKYDNLCKTLDKTLQEADELEKAHAMQRVQSLLKERLGSKHMASALTTSRPPRPPSSTPSPPFVDLGRICHNALETIFLAYGWTDEKSSWKKIVAENAEFDVLHNSRGPDYPDDVIQMNLKNVSSAIKNAAVYIEEYRHNFKKPRELPYYENLQIALTAIIKSNGYKDLTLAQLRHVAALHAALYANRDNTQLILRQTPASLTYFVRLMVDDAKSEFLEVKLRYLNFSYETSLRWVQNIILSRYRANLGLPEFNESVELWNPISMEYADRLFCNCERFTGRGIDKWNLAKLQYAREMFFGCGNFVPDTVDNWQLMNLFDATEMFFRCRNFTGTGANEWNLCNLQMGGCMFYGCIIFNPDSVAKWNPCKLTKASNMFFGCQQFSGKGLETWELSSLEEAVGMFSDCNNLNPESLESWKPSNLQNATMMFESCTSFTGRGVEKWDLQMLTEAYRMFFECVSFNPMQAGMGNMQQLKCADFMFCNCREFNGDWLRDWRTIGLTSARGMFKGCTNLNLENLKCWDLSRVSYEFCFELFNDVPVTEPDLEILKTIQLYLGPGLTAEEAIRHVFGVDHGNGLIKDYQRVDKNPLIDACRCWV